MLLVCVAVLLNFNAVSSDGDFTTHNMQDILRDKLQIGNDDYKDKLRNGPEPTMKGADKFFHSPNRRTLVPPAPGATAPTDAGAAASVETNKQSNKTSAEPDASRNPKSIKKPVRVDPSKVNKLRNFLDKYKVIVNDFMANRSASAAQATRPESRLARARTSPQWASASREDVPGPPQWASASREEAPGLRARPPPEPGLRPSATQLDMSPARGGLVYNLRTKNRLCHRNVMIPEGPKYDSKGRVYLAAFEPVRGREYEHTVPPRLLLPKCCNCCRKSVLGCE